ncbi:MAG: alpha/beta fold hydrolase [Planctomycetota bacterium]
MSLNRSRLKRAATLFVAAPLAVVCLGLTACQGRLIYPAPRYAQVMWDRLPPTLEPLRYETDQGKQVSFYQRPAAGGAPDRLWLVCSGNGGVALTWPDFLATAPDLHAGFLLLDYPGYGFSEGSCTPARILRASEAAVEALRQHLNLTQEQIDQRLGVFGHSLGAAAVLQYAAQHPVRRIILVAPFTTMVQEVHHVLFWPMGWMVWHRFDNEDRLNEIAAHKPRPPVDIIHGDIDHMIPPEMGQQLAEQHPDWIRFTLIPGADHNDVADDAVKFLREP